MIKLDEQIKKDAAKYQEIINSKADKYWESMPQVPVNSDIGENYMKSYRDNNPYPHVLKLSREAIAFLYLKLYEETAGGIAGMSGDLAVGFANYDPQNLPTPEEPRRSDPNWDPNRANKNSIMLGYWDPNNGPSKGKGILPFSAEVFRGGRNVEVKLYDDWSQEWP